MENEMRLINAMPIKKFIEDRLNCKDPLNAFGYDAIEILTEIEYAPVIDPEILRPKGWWEPMGETDYKCSVCGFRFTSGDPIKMFPYCRCGAKMEA